MIQSMDTDSTGQCVTKREIPSLKRRLKALATATFEMVYAYDYILRIVSSLALPRLTVRQVRACTERFGVGR